ncbi:MAG TPA: alpha/beta hydrolase [Pseudonocardiaceae bacterium]
MTTGAGFRVTVSALTDAANDLTGQAGTLSSVHLTLTSAPLPATAFGSMPQSQQVAQAHTSTMTKLGQDVDVENKRAATLATGLTNSATNYTQGDQTAAGYYKSLLDGQTTNGSGGSTGVDSGAFGNQIAANRVKVANALGTEQTNNAALRQRLADLYAQDKTGPVDDFGRTMNNYEESQLTGQIAASDQKIALYQDIIANNRKIIAFDPTGDGRIAELIGNIGPNTKNVGVLVPGTFTNMSDFNGYAQDAASFVKANPNGDLAMVAWANGSFPQSLAPAAASPSYAQTSAPVLADFSHQLRDQVNQFAGPGNNVQVTYAGHSYGGPIVGLAEQGGLDANRTLYVESPGMGHDVWAPGDLHDTQPNVQRYSMTAPGDPIGLFQGVQVFGQGHGADPNTFPGVTDLTTGNYPNGQPIYGLAAHNGVLTPGSDSWRNMYGVFTGGPVSTQPQPVPQPDPFLYLP